MKKQSLFSKLKNISNWEIYLACFVCLVVAICFFFFPKNNAQTVEADSQFDQFDKQLENKLKKVISAMNGVGKVEVAITYESSAEKVFATQSKLQKSGEGTLEEYVYLNGNPVVTKEMLPTIKGVAVVAEGAKNPVVKMQIVQIVVTLLDVDSSKVQVFC